jgi:hypothetical protein
LLTAETPLHRRGAWLSAGSAGTIEIERRIGRRPFVTTEIYDDHGIRFVYPSDWEVEITDEGSVITVGLEHPGGIAFVLVRNDESCPDPEELADLALEAMRDEYPSLDVIAVNEMIDDHTVAGHDVEFFSLDIASAASIRSFRTPRRTLLVFGQWSDLGEDDLSEVVSGVFHSLEETGD